MGERGWKRRRGRKKIAKHKVKGDDRGGRKRHEEDEELDEEQEEGED